MKTITFEEFAELAKKDEALQEKIKDAAENFGGQLASELSRIAEEAGYELKKEEHLDMEALDDDDLENVAGGVKNGQKGGNPFCEAIMEFFGYNINLCY